MPAARRSPCPPLPQRPLHATSAAITPWPPVATAPRDDDRAAWLAERHTAAFAQPGMPRLRDALTAHGGWGLVPGAPEPHLAALLSERAAVWPGRDARWATGQGNRCHGNAAARFLSRWPRLLIGTGYALSEDGVWRGHSWLFEHRGGVPTRVVETTVGRILYAGVVLDPAGVANPVGRAFLPGGVDSLRFCLANLDTLDAAPAITDVVDAAVRRDPRFLAVIAVATGEAVDTVAVRSAIARQRTAAASPAQPESAR